MYDISTYIWLILITYGFYLPTSPVVFQPSIFFRRRLAVSFREGSHPATPEAKAPEKPTRNGPQFQHEAHEGHGQRDNKSHGSLPHHTWPPANHAVIFRPVP